MNILNAYPRDTVRVLKTSNTFSAYRSKLFTVDFFYNAQEFQAMGQFSPKVPLSECVIEQRAFQTFEVPLLSTHQGINTQFEIIGGNMPNRVVSFDEWTALKNSLQANELMWRVLN